MSGVGFFIITEGEASVIGRRERGRAARRRRPFGELALISEGVRSATVTAVTQLECLEITFWDFRKIAKDNPDIAWKLLQYVVGLLIDERMPARSRSQTSLGRTSATGARVSDA